MSDGMNKVMLLGNLGADPELRHTASGDAVLNLRIATTETWFDKESKSEKSRTEWHNVVLFGNRATALARILSKGSPVLVEGGLRTSSYEKDGVKRWKTDVYAREVYLLGRKPASDAPHAGGNGRSARADDTMDTDALPF